MSATDRILVTGAAGQIGSELTTALREIYRNKNVIATDVKSPSEELQNEGPFETLDVTDKDRLQAIIKEYKITQIYHLAAILSATGEQKPQLAWTVNMDGLLNMLSVGKEQNVEKIFWPSSIAVFGPSTPKKDTPQHTVMDPDTVYGISKLAGERWCAYYHEKYDLDVRSVRYPGLISYKTEPGGGTTDYAVEIFYQAIEENAYECFLAKDMKLPMMYMPDAIKATIDIMEVPADKIHVRSSYNIHSLSFSPQELAKEIQNHQPGFQITYNPDYRQKIAASWPSSVDDQPARDDWSWEPDYDLSSMTEEMLRAIQKKLASQV